MITMIATFESVAVKHLPKLQKAIDLLDGEASFVTGSQLKRSIATVREEAQTACNGNQITELDFQRFSKILDILEERGLQS